MTSGPSANTGASGGGGGGGSADSKGASTKCSSCGSTSIDVDPSRGDAVCTQCGEVLETSLIVSDVQFEENAHGGAAAIGQFVSGDSKGGGSMGSMGIGGGGGGGGRRVLLGQFQGFSIGYWRLCRHARKDEAPVDREPL